MESGKNAVRLLETEDERLEQFSYEIERYNDDRKELDKKATEEAIEIIDKLEDDFNYQTKKTTVVFDETWHKGIVGIVASRLVEKYFRPTIVFTKSGEMYTGSARSVKGFDVYEAIEKCEDLIEHWGGHKYAAGLSIRPENFKAFKQKFEEVVNDMVNGRDFVPKVKIDAIINFEDITEEFFDYLEKFEPYGPRNLRPTFQTNNVIDSGFSRIVGDKHIKLSVMQKDFRNQVINGIAFKQFDKIDIVKNSTFDICYTLEKNEWKGKTNIQLNVIDIRKA
jgi:single-stranded-DNA-specific exonuclease